MKNLLTINDNDFEPEGYTVRNVVRAVIFDPTHAKILFIGGLIVGGGVEEGETDTQALAREAMEEAGVCIEVGEPVGEIIAYRDFLKKKYIIRAYRCTQIGQLGVPSTTDPDEQGIPVFWSGIQESIQRLEHELEDLSLRYAGVRDEVSQRRIQHRKINLVILREISA